jgi:hypothetical protein
MERTLLFTALKLPVMEGRSGHRAADHLVPLVLLSPHRATRDKRGQSDDALSNSFSAVTPIRCALPH